MPETPPQPDTAPSPLSTGEVLRKALKFYDGLNRPHVPGEAKLLDEMAAAISQPPATEQIRREVIEALTLLLAAAKFMPRTTPKPGGASTQHVDYKIEAAYVWALDAACKAAERVLAATEQER